MSSNPPLIRYATYFGVLAGAAMMVGASVDLWVEQTRRHAASVWPVDARAELPVAHGTPLPVFTAKDLDASRLSPVGTATAAEVEPVLETVKSPEPEAVRHPEVRGRVNVDGLNVRVAPRKGSHTVAVLQLGEEVRATQNSGGWVRIVGANGTAGWVYSQYLAPVQ